MLISIVQQSELTLCIHISPRFGGLLSHLEYWVGFSGSSAGKEFACLARDPDLIPGLGRSLGEGIGYPPQCSWASLVAQTVKNPPAIQETWVWSLSWEDPLEEGMATHSSILAWRIPMDRGAWWATVHRVTKSRTQLIEQKGQILFDSTYMRYLEYLTW